MNRQHDCTAHKCTGYIVRVCAYRTVSTLWKEKPNALEELLCSTLEFEVNSNKQAVNNRGGSEKGRCVREEPRIFQSESPQAIAGLAGHLSPDKGIRQFCILELSILEKISKVAT